MDYIDWIGFTGVALLLLAFFLNLKGTLKKENSVYLLLNFTGASIACAASVLLEYMPFVILEGCWAIVSAFELLKTVNRNKITS